MRCPYCNEKLYASYEIQEHVKPMYGDVYEDKAKNVIVHEDRRRRTLQVIQDSSLIIIFCPLCEKILTTEYSKA